MRDREREREIEREEETGCWAGRQPGRWGTAASMAPLVAAHTHSVDVWPARSVLACRK
jgi:hypothetical protein